MSVKNAWKIHKLKFLRDFCYLACILNIFGHKESIMSDYQLNFLDRRIQYLEGKIQDWEKVIDQLMKNESFMHALEVEEMKKNQTVNTDSSYIVKANYND